MAIYPAVFEPNEKNGFAVLFPDLPGCFTEGDDEQDAMAMAIDALSGHIHALRDLGREAPKPSAIASLEVPPGARVALVPGPAEESPPIRINISINKDLLRDVDSFAKREGMTRSGFLAAAAKSMMTKLRA
ncbi:MAG: type II toxin-antitoxin system HicB family antitoxin [Solidesulfovibrio sp.]